MRYVPTFLLAPTFLFAFMAITGLTPSSARAQWDPEGGDTGDPPVTNPPPQQNPPPDEGLPPALQERPREREPVEAPPRQGAGWWGNSSEEAPSEGGGGRARRRSGDDDDDHLGAVGRFALGFFGLPSVPTGPLVDGSPPNTEVTTPTIGIRYWFSDGVGLQLGVGLGYTSAVLTANGDDQPSANIMGFRATAGLPIALAHQSHFAFLFIPDIAIGIANGRAPTTRVKEDGNGLSEGDDLFSGFLFSAGAQLGIELHFGFLGVPQLSLQGGIGVDLEISSATQDLCAADDCDAGNKSTLGSLGIGTTSSIAAFYYF